MPSPIPFTLDGQADAAGYLQNANGMAIYAAVRGGILYIATASPGNSGQPNDNFVFVTDQLLTSASAFAPWAKSGMIAADASKPFIGGESTNDFCGWFNAPASSAAVKSPTITGQMESTIDLTAAFGDVPETIYVAAAAYATGDGGRLAAEGLPGNGDGNVDPNEFLALPIVAITDENADGLYDRLDPTRGFLVMQITRTGGVTTITWASVPGKTYQLESCDVPGGTWFPLNAPLTAGTDQLTLSTTDSAGLSGRFYRVELVNP